MSSNHAQLLFTTLKLHLQRRRASQTLPSNVVIAMQQQDLSDAKDSIIIVANNAVFTCREGGDAQRVHYVELAAGGEWQCRGCDVEFRNAGNGLLVAAYCAERNVLLVDPQLDATSVLALYRIARMSVEGRIQYSSMLMDPWSSIAMLMGLFSRRIIVNPVRIDTRRCIEGNVNATISSDEIVLYVERSGETSIVTIGGELYELSETLRYEFHVKVQYDLDGNPRLVSGWGYVECCDTAYPHPNINDETGEVCLGSYKLPVLDVSREVCIQLAKVRDDIVRVLSVPELLDAYHRDIYHLIRRGVIDAKRIRGWGEAQ